MAVGTFVRRILAPMVVLGLALAHAQTITKVSGDGQIVIQSILSSNPDRHLPGYRGLSGADHSGSAESATPRIPDSGYRRRAVEQLISLAV